MCYCGEDGDEVVTCWQCGATRCEDCATVSEVENQCCGECLNRGDAMRSELRRIVREDDAARTLEQSESTG